MLRKASFIAAGLVLPLFTGVAAATPAHATVIAATTSTTMWVKAGVTLNVRSGPSTTYAKVGTVSGGAALAGAPTGTGWFKITSGTYSGRYVSMSYLTTVNPSPATVQMWVVANFTLNVRTGPGTTYTKVGTVSGGTALTGVPSNGWLKITSGTYSGRYVSMSYLTSVNPNSFSRWVRASGAQVRTAASATSTLLATLPKDTQVTGIAGTNGWTRLTAGTYKDRYVLTSSLTFAKSMLPTAPEWTCSVKSGDSMLQEWPAKVRTRILAQFAPPTIGGYRETTSGEHGLGLALDVMVYNDKAKGDAVRDWAVANAAALNIYYVIWEQHIYGAWTGWKPVLMEDRGSITQNHFDHVHISFHSGSGTCPA